jgi:(1->4)-alpha-D-glucan 1-alpha-D-glucosylmutase
LRVDHPDGLRDPAGYLRRLADRAGGTWTVVEKILEPGEALRSDWPVAGTTGYEVLHLLNGLFVDAAAEPELTAAWAAYTGDHRPFDAIAQECKRMIVRDVLAADVARLVNLGVRFCESEIDHRDHSRAELRAVTEELLVAFPVYRTYVRPGEPPSLADGAVIERVLDDVAARRPDIDRGLVDLMGTLLLCRSGSPLGDRFAERFQQLTAPVLAKAVEDTAFYRYVRLAAVNEVGGDPGRLGSTVGELHAANVVAAAEHPHRMVCTSTHDTKRSEDVRLAIAALSEVPQRWRAASERWGARCSELMAGAPRDREIEYLLHQTLVGAHPLDRPRAHEHLTKAMREAKQATSWLRPDEAHEARMHALLDGLLADPAHMAEVAELARATVHAARTAALSQRLLALTVPGVPDLYQGSELYTDGLVDPDNRRPVDYAERAAMLERVLAADPLAIAEAWSRDPNDGGAAKLWVTTRGLHVRRELPDAFVGRAATYAPLTAAGPARDHAIAFVRGGRVITVATRLAGVLADHGGWGDTVIGLPSGRWRDVLSGRAVDGGDRPLAQLLGSFPVALLVAEAGR